jgi:uncharacterized membrane protein YgcG
MRIRTLLALAAALALLFAAMPRDAQADEGWTIERFAAQIAIQRDGSLLITESIDVDFGALVKHGIFRDIPIEYSIPGDDKHHRIYGFEAVSVTDAAGEPWPYTQSRVGANVRLKIGDADRTISGKQSYRIVYRVRDALNAFPDHDELYWNVNGPDWPVRTNAAAAAVSLKGGGIERADCFEGPTGSTANCTAALGADGSTARFDATRPFGPGDEMTIVAAIRKGAVAEPAVRLVDKPKSAFERYFELTPLTVIGAAIVSVLGLMFFAYNWWRNGRDRTYTSIYYLTNDPTQETRTLFHRDQVVVEYTPPDGLRPAQMGVLLDERADTKDATATIVDLAVRGYLSIEELDKSWIFGKKDWKLTKKKDDEALQPFERTILLGLFEKGGEVQVSDLKNEYHTSLAQAQEQLYADTVSRGWFGKSPDAARTSASATAVAVGVAGAAIGYGLGRFFGAALVGVPVVGIGALMLATTGWMPKRTAKGSEALRRVLGFRLYIDTAETRRQEFNEKANIFAEYLPYAIVFGCVEKWAQVFRDIDTTAATGGWYLGAAAFSAPAFSRSMETFSSSVSHVISSTPGSSGGSGFSGGSSGGGGGGGGGGSW